MPSSLIGNEAAKRLLEKIVASGNIPHALLFHGPQGVGKTLFAKAFATQLLGSSHSPDLHILQPDEKSHLHLIETIRDYLTEMLLPPFSAPCKVFIVEDAHKMFPVSSNALLKTLEEPPPNSYTILLTDEPQNILPTIHSRCRAIPFFPIPEELILSHLLTYHPRLTKQAPRIAALSQGSLSKALLLASEPYQKKQQLLLEMLTHTQPQDFPYLLKLATELGDLTDHDLDPLLEEIFAWYRDRTLLQHNLPPHYFRDHAPILKLLPPPPPLEHVWEAITQTQLAITRHVRPRTALSHLLLSLS